METRLAILEVLSNVAEPMRPSDIGEYIGENSLNTGRYLSNMAESSLTQRPNKKKSFYEITDKGREYLANLPKEIEEEPPKGTTEGKHGKETQMKLQEKLQRKRQDKPEEKQAKYIIINDKNREWVDAEDKRASTPQGVDVTGTEVTETR